MIAGTLPERYINKKRTFDESFQIFREEFFEAMRTGGMEFLAKKAIEERRRKEATEKPR